MLEGEDKVSFSDKVLPEQKDWKDGVVYRVVLDIRQDSRDSDTEFSEHPHNSYSNTTYW